MFGKKIKIGINGMSCNHCAKRVEEGLGKMDGIKSVKVNLDEKYVLITYKDELSLDKVKNEIEELGYEFIGVQS